MILCFFLVRALGEGVSTERVTVGTEGSESNGDSFSPSISQDGRFVAFESRASNLVANDTNGRRDIFVRDRQTGTTERISFSTESTESNGDSFNPSVGQDGRFVAFESRASNLVANDRSMPPQAP